MKILFLIQSNPVLSGGAYYYFMQAAALKKLRHKVKVVSNFSHKLDFIDIEENPKYTTKEKGFDAVFGTQYHGARQGFKYAKEWDVPFYLSMCEPRNYLSTHPGRSVEADKDDWQYFAEIAKKAKEVFTLSKHAASYFPEWIGREPKVIYPCLNTKTADKVKVKEEKNQVIFINRLDGYKNASIAIQAIEGLGIELVLIGGGSNKSIHNTIELAENKGIVVHHYHGIEETEKWKLIKESKALLFPSEFEGFGLPPGETLYCKKPAITRPLPTLKEAYGEHLIYADGVDAMRAKLMILLNNEEKRKKIGEKGYEFVKDHYTFNHMVQRMKEVFPQ